MFLYSQTFFIIMKLLLLLGFVAAASAISFVEVSKEEWNSFKVCIIFSFYPFGKTQNPSNIYLRKNVLRRIFSHCKQASFCVVT